MASTQTPAAFVQNENLHIHRGKGADGGKAKTELKKGLRERKPLVDLSKPGKPLAPKTKDTINAKTRKPPKTNPTAADKPPTPSDTLLTDNDTRNCQEWAKEGIEHLHFTANDLHKLESDAHKERVRNEVDMVMSSLRSWTQTGYGLGLPPMEIPRDTGPISKLELEPEVTLPKETRLSSISGDEELDAFLEAELSLFHSFDDDDFVLKLKESDDDDVLLLIYV